MTKTEAAAYLGVSERSLERHTKDNRIGVRYERGKTKPVPVYDQSELERFKAELETPVHRPAVEKMAPSFDSGAIAAAPSGAIQSRPEDFLQVLESVISATAREVVKAMAPEGVKIDSKRRGTEEVPISARTLLSVAESAAYLGVSVATIERAIKAEALAVHRELARGRRIKRADLDKWADQI